MSRAKAEAAALETGEELDDTMQQYQGRRGTVVTDARPTIGSKSVRSHRLTAPSNRSSRARSSSRLQQRLSYLRSSASGLRESENKNGSGTNNNKLTSTGLLGGGGAKGGLMLDLRDEAAVLETRARDPTIRHLAFLWKDYHPGTDLVVSL